MTQITISGFTFEVYALNSNFNQVSGIYTFLRYDTITNMYYIYYIGMTDNLSIRIANHHKIDEAKINGCQYLGFLFVADESLRTKREKQLIAYCTPPLNDKIG